MKRLLLLFLPCAAFAAAPSSDWSPNTTTTIAWDSNVSNGEAVWDRIGAIDLGADVLASSQYALTSHDAMHTTMHFAANCFPRFYQLTSVTGGARLDWQHTFGEDAFAPVLTVEASGDVIPTVEVARRSVLGAIDLNLSKRLGAAWRITLRERFEDNHAHNAVFDRRSSEASAAISRDINETTRFVLTGRWREGDVVTYAQYRRPDLVAIADHLAALNTFREAMTAYAANARTLGGRVELVHATSEATAVVLAYDYAQTSRTGLRFANQTVSLGFVRQY